MKTEIALISLLAMAGVALFFQQSEISIDSQSPSAYLAYTNWKAKFGITGTSDDLYRFSQFQENFNFIHRHNAQSKGDQVKLGFTQFAAMGLQEYKDTILIRKAFQHIKPTEEVNTEEGSIFVGAIEPTLNWVAKGAVNAIQNQGNCGSCWAFSAVSQLEGLQEIDSGNLLKFSEQQVTSCDPSSNGCNGGQPDKAFGYVAQKGIESEASYPYEQLNNPRTQPCQYDQSKTIYNNKSYGNVAASNPSAMLQQIQTQPLSILIDAGNVYFQLYSSGILDAANCGNQLDHAISLVGYDSTNSQQYWAVRNSWGTTWGIQGYAKIAGARGNGICGMNMSVSYPTSQQTN